MKKKSGSICSKVSDFVEMFLRYIFTLLPPKAAILKGLTSDSGQTTDDRLQGSILMPKTLIASIIHKHNTHPQYSLLRTQHIPYSNEKGF